MVYMEKFIAVVKHNGKILRERDGFVSLPFGSEYSLLLKNKNSVKAVVNVEIDGQDVLDGNQLIVNPNSYLELNGFMKGTKVVNKFKSIQKTKQIADYRGDRVDDGIIRVEFRFEKTVREVITKQHTIQDPPWIRYGGGHWWEYTGTGNQFNGYSNNTTHYFCSDNTSKNLDSFSGTVNCSFSCNYQQEPLNDEVITVKGSKVDQQFVYGYTRELENDSRVIILRLRGIKDSGKLVRKPITVKTKITCPTCGLRSRSNAQFCRRCGTCIE